MQNEEAETIAFIRRGYELWNDDDVDGLARQILSEDVSFQNPPDWPGQSTYHGREEVARFLREEVAAVSSWATSRYSASRWSATST